MLLLELGQLTLDETSNISEPSIASSRFLTAALPISLSSPLPTENRTSVSKTSVIKVVTKILRALKLGKTRFQSQLVR